MSEEQKSFAKKENQLAEQVWGDLQVQESWGEVWYLDNCDGN